MSDTALDEHGLFTDDQAKMTLTSGRRVNPLHLQPVDIFVDDIAHALARQCRYNGHVGGYLSVARHSIWVAERLIDLGRRDLALAGLLHDAGEAYLGDMIRPLKHGDMGASYRVVEERVDAAIAEQFNLPHPLPDEVLAADTFVLLEVELGGEQQRWRWTSTVDVDTIDFLALFDRLAPDPLEEDTLVVALCGYAQAGKDTVGNILVEQHGFERLAFADALRDMLYALNPDTWVRWPEDGGVTSPVPWPVELIVDRHGWEWAKANTGVRELLQRLGTEAGRNILGDSIWVDTCLAKIKPGGRYVITDCRFPNEADAVRNLGGQVVRVTRPGCGPVNGHPSETALDDYRFDAEILNDGTFDYLERMVRLNVRGASGAAVPA
jgi:hypothetical protein